MACRRHRFIGGSRTVWPDSRPLRAVYGNIDGQDLRIRFPEINRFQLEGTDILIKHIGGYPGKYDSSIRETLMTHPPKLFISGHSHILKVKYDPQPGATSISTRELPENMVFIGYAHLYDST